MEVEGPLTAVAGLQELEPLFKQLHRHHQLVATYGPLVSDVDEAWVLRRRWYEEILAAGGSYFLVRDQDGTSQGYGLIEISLTPDDTFAARGGIVEVVSLVVDEQGRGKGAGRALVAAIEDHARRLGAEVLRVAVMAGNASALAFYTGDGFSVGEHVMYRSVRPVVRDRTGMR